MNPSPERMLTSNPHRRTLATRLARVVRGAACTWLLATNGCHFEEVPSPKQAEWRELRAAEKSNKPERVSDWLVAEMLIPGGTAAGAEKARKQLDQIGAEGVRPSLLRGILDAKHGHSRAALEHFFDALVRARTWEDDRAPLYAWFAALRAQELAEWDPKFTERHHARIDEILEDPGAIGFRAYSLVVNFWASHAFSEAVDDIDERLAKRLGCARDLSLAGPFGQGQKADLLREYPAERPFTWPEVFPREEGQPKPPRLLSVDMIGCDAVIDESVEGGVFYAQTFLELDEDRELILAAGGATQLWVNDNLRLDRDLRTWGSWPRWAVRVSLPAGRHRVVYKTLNTETSLRILTPQGRPARVRTSTDQGPGYDKRPPESAEDPNALMRYIRPDGVQDPGDPLTRYVSAYLADDEGQSDVAAVLFEPFVESIDEATGISLQTAALFVRGDPIYDETQTRDLAHELELRAARHDPALWSARFQNLVWEAEQKGATTVVKDLEAMWRQFPEIPSIGFTLVQLYDELGWGPEYETALSELSSRFPRDEEVIKLAIDHHEEEGDRKKVDELLQRIVEVNPDTELLVARALNRRDYAAALAELRRLQARRPGRDDIKPRMERILVNSGQQRRTLEQLENDVQRHPKDAHARLALADALLARGKNDALSTALVEAVSAGADPSPIEGAIDLLEGITALEPFRLDGAQVIREYEARDHHLSGTAARVLDYGAVWINPDGSSRFLEHEIVRIQSEEAIKRFAEESSRGLVLSLRVIKSDGTILEPEQVPGKPTVTMPHLAIGDYIETERIISRWGDGVGEVYEGPGWYFREADVAYARSEFVIIAPREKDLILETHNDVPEPEVDKTGSLVVIRYRVDDSPAAPVEPMSPPVSEFLPRVQVGWGLSFERQLERMSRAMIPLDPVDPRIVEIASNIVAGKTSQDAQARALYHWVLDSVQDGEEQDGRRVVVARNGNRFRAFETLCRALSIPVSWAVAESRLASPPTGPISSANRPLTPLLVVGEGEKRTFLTIEDKFAPYGHVPSFLRGEPAHLLGRWTPETTRVPSEGSIDGIAYEGRGQLTAEGDLKLELDIIFKGSYAASLRNGLSQIPENQLGNVIESRLLAAQLPGARLLGHEVKNQADLDRPLTISVATEVPHFATQSSMGLLISPPFMPRLSQLTTLATRKTPLMIGQETTQSIDLRISLPPRSEADVRRTTGKSQYAAHTISDEVGDGVLHLVRDVDTSAGRVQPSEYPDFQEYTNRADAALNAAIRVTVAPAP